MSSLAIGSFMRTPAPFVHRDTPLNDVVQMLHLTRLTGLPVTDDRLHVVGFVSERDCIHALLVSCYHDEGDPLVSEVMKPAQCLAPHDSLIEVAERMAQIGAPRIYPVTEEGELVGLITRGQVLEVVAADRLHRDRPRTAA